MNGRDEDATFLPLNSRIGGQSKQPPYSGTIPDQRSSKTYTQKGRDGRDN